jgi:predicted transcriptional regulator
MNKKQKEALVIALSEKGKTYREIAKEAGVSPNTIKAILNKAGLDQTTSISSRVFELYSQNKTPLEVAITLGLKSEEVLRYHQEYFMLLGCTEFTKVYLQIKDNPWPYVNLVKLVLNSGMGDGEIVELLKIANEHLPRVRLEYDRLKAELNSLKAEISNSVRIYQDFCDRNVELKNREDELQLTISELEGKMADLQKTGFNESLSQFQENNADITNLNPEVKQEDVISTNDVSIPPSNMVTNYHHNENEMLHYSSSPLLTSNESSSQTLQVPDIQDGPASVSGGNHEILDTGDLSKVYLAYNHITFQIYPDVKISNGTGRTVK